jgi:hypothetical protein
VGWPSFIGGRLEAPDVTPPGNSRHGPDRGTTFHGTPGQATELLGGHGNDTLHGGGGNDVIWGDAIPNGPSTQHDRLYGGTGNVFIYTSRGYNYVVSGPGHDVIHAEFGRGIIYCGRRDDIVYVKPQSRRSYHFHGCRRFVTVMRR